MLTLVSRYLLPASRRIEVHAHAMPVGLQTSYLIYWRAWDSSMNDKRTITHYMRTMLRAKSYQCGRAACTRWILTFSCSRTFNAHTSMHIAL
jgi:hypothetical protein